MLIRKWLPSRKSVWGSHFLLSEKVLKFCSVRSYLVVITGDLQKNYISQFQELVLKKLPKKMSNYLGDIFE